jgi:hypothetical protein
LDHNTLLYHPVGTARKEEVVRRLCRMIAVEGLEAHRQELTRINKEV